MEMSSVNRNGKCPTEYLSMCWAKLVCKCKWSVANNIQTFSEATIFHWILMKSPYIEWKILFWTKHFHKTKRTNHFSSDCINQNIFFYCTCTMHSAYTQPTDCDTSANTKYRFIDNWNSWLDDRLHHSVHTFCLAALMQLVVVVIDAFCVWIISIIQLSCCLLFALFNIQKSEALNTCEWSIVFHWMRIEGSCCTDRFNCSLFWILFFSY